MWAIACGDSVVELNSEYGRFMAIFSTRNRAREIMKVLKEDSSNELSNKSFKIHKVDVIKSED